jgi:nucleotide-binding universal stress UspA family protein
MYNKILAPLDGSDLAECTLEHLKTIASGCGIQNIIVFRVIEPLPAATLSAVAAAGGNLLNEMETTNRKNAEQYIQEVAAKLKTEGFNVQPVTAEGHAAEEILKYAENNDVDLIIMSTHGRTGIKRWVMGSVTSRVLDHSTVPVLTIIPKGCRLNT